MHRVWDGMDFNFLGELLGLYAAQAKAKTAKEGNGNFHVPGIVIQK
jgi:hypothetical protein